MQKKREHRKSLNDGGRREESRFLFLSQGIKSLLDLDGVQHCPDGGEQA